MLGGFIWPRPGPVLKGKRIYLRLPTRRDCRAWLDLRGKNRGFLQPWEPLWRIDEMTVEGYRQRVQDTAREARSGRGYSFLIFRLADDRLLGGISLYNLRRDTAQSGMLGYWIGEAHARQGVMNEALDLVLRFCCDELKLHRVEAACLPENEASKRLLTRAGFAQEGFARKYLSINGAWRDHLLFGLVMEEWASQSTSQAPRPALAGSPDNGENAGDTPGVRSGVAGFGR